MVADKGKKTKVEEENTEQIDSELVLSIEKLQEIQDELEKINEEASDKVLEVEQKYSEVRKPVYDKRNDIIKSIPDFWLTAFISHPALGELLSEEDQKIRRNWPSNLGFVNFNCRFCGLGKFQGCKNDIVKQNILAERDTEQAIRALKKDWGKLAHSEFAKIQKSMKDEKLLIWYSGKEEKQVKLSHISRIIPGQRTICKDRDEAELWFTALRALISRGNYCKSTSDSISSDSPRSHTRKNSPSNISSTSSDILYKDPGDTQTILVPYENSPQNRLGKAFSEVISYTAAAKAFTRAESVAKSISFVSSGGLDDTNGHSSGVNSNRYSSSSAVSSSSQGSREDFDSLCDVFIWGEGLGDVLLGSGVHVVRKSSAVRSDALLPKALESKAVLDAHNIGCGSKHAVVVTKQGQIFSWGDGSGGRLGHGLEANVSFPKLIDAFSESNIDLVACGEFHTCAVTHSGDLYTWVMVFTILVFLGM
ncbi:hypothetical protein Dsin_006592 [Dipteronia sinensis]|uniref:Uncharacterized protein n=1 Tax=Dipteronia sinensis TaxID=43782 RepID=A0AAE0AZK9_9ROSI|nr:hypothetical protein Dsin_006592 [Dipteronia sinensis]